MELLALIQEVLQDKCIIYLNQPSFSLLEGNPGGACSEVKVSVTGPCIVCRFESEMTCDGVNKIDIFPYHKNLKNVKKMCDYIIFYKHKTDDNLVYVFLCELKGGGTYRMQLKAGYSFARFIIDAARRRGEYHDAKPYPVNYAENIEYRGTVFTNAALNKYTIDPDRGETIEVDPHSRKHIQCIEIECKKIIDSFELNKYAY